MAKVFRTFFPVILLGDGAVGKTSLILQTVNNQFNDSLLSTIGVDYMEKKTKVDDKEIKLKIYDTAGQERFKGIALNTIRNSEGVLLVYGIDSESSFKNLEEWMENIQGVINTAKKPIILIGNKCDLPNEERKVEKSKGEEFAKKFGIKFYECSAKENINVNEAFDDLLHQMYEIHKDEFGPNGMEQHNTKLEKKEKKEKTGKSCC